MGAIFEPFIFKTAHKNVSQSWIQWRPHSRTINLFIEICLQEICCIGTPAYKLAKFLLPFLTPLTENEYTVTDSFHFIQMLIPYLLTFHRTKPLIFVVIVYATIMRTPRRSLRKFFVIWLTQPQKNRFLCLTNSINKLMLWLWDLH